MAMNGGYSFFPKSWSLKSSLASQRCPVAQHMALLDRLLLNILHRSDNRRYCVHAFFVNMGSICCMAFVQCTFISCFIGSLLIP